MAEDDPLETCPGAPEFAGERRVVLVAAVALVDADGRVLIAQRPAGKPMAGLWEFPGGKIGPGETPHAYDDFHLLMPLFVCRKWRGTPKPLEGQALKWARVNELKNYPMPPADVPLIAQLRDLL
jgi:8-oxo-dGTP diphosphatase